MAVIQFTRSEPSASKAKIVTWAAIANADTAAPFLPVELDTAIASVQISGTFGGAAPAGRSGGRRRDRVRIRPVGWR